MEVIILKRAKKTSSNLGFLRVCSRCKEYVPGESYWCPKCGACFDENVKPDFEIPGHVLDIYLYETIEEYNRTHSDN